MLEHLIQKHSDDDEIFVMYDIACMLRKHLQSQGMSDMLDRVHLCLPIFHCYGHKASCQVLLGPRRCEGIGLSDGETMERLWSYLRRFGKMTKEMRPAHRIDILSHALAYYGMQKLARLLVTRMERAQQTQVVAMETFHELVASSDISEEDVEKWLVEETAFHTNELKPAVVSKLCTWKFVYFQTLQSYYLLREKLTCGEHSDHSTTYSEIARLNRSLEDTEKKYGVVSRWLPMDKEYQNAKSSIAFLKQEQVTSSMWEASVRQQYLLKLKARYADGQKIAKKLSTQITKETRKIKTLLQEYAACQSVIEPTVFSNPLTLAEALDPSVLSSIISSSIPGQLYTDRRDVIDAYILMKRSREEIVLIENDMKNTISYYSERERTIVLMHIVEVPRPCYTIYY